jgi:predicted RNase H-like HicB family nuclease
MPEAQKHDIIQAKSYIFNVVIEEDAFEDGRPAFHASVPALKGCHTWASSYDEALTNVQEAVTLYVDDLLEAGEQIPAEPRDDVLVRSSPAVVVNV